MTTLQTFLPTGTTLTADGALVVGLHNPVDATASARAMTLPTPTRVGARLRVEKADSTANAVAVSGTIRGSASTISLVLFREQLEFVAESLTSWRPVSDHKTLSSMDDRFTKTTESSLSPARFGAVGDGVTDDSAALQAWADACATRGIPGRLEAKTYLVNSATVLLESGIDYSGRGRTSVLLRGPGLPAGSPVVASKNWKVGAGGSITGRSHWHDFTVDGASTTGAGDYGLVFRGYYALLEDIEVRNCGGPGFALLAKDSGGTIYSGASLVDGRVRNIDVANCGLGGAAGMFLGEQSNNKFTDWYLSDVYINSPAAATAGLYCGSAPGWKMRRIHAYGTPNGNAMQVLNASQLDADDLYLEHWVGAALYFGAIQRGNNIGRITARGMSADGYIVQVASLAGSVTSGSLNVDAIAVVQDINGPVTAVRNDISTCAVTVGKISRDGDFSSQITKVSGFGAPQVKYQADTKTDTTIRDSAQGKTITVKPAAGTNAQPLALSKWVEWNGGAAQAIDIQLPDARTFDVYGVTLMVGSKATYTGSARTSWQALVMVGTAGTTTPFVSTVQVLAPTGFTVAPTVTSSVGKITVSFTSATSDDQGFVSAVMAYE